MPPLDDSAGWASTPAPWCRIGWCVASFLVGVAVTRAYFWLSYRRGE